ncbi:MAG: Abi family protein [Bacteroidales bacterium]|nr:Abi family protein [Bacteroidales bacterium]MCM1416994.1 Abi family protein [bacterium]MCM1424803.1 Abi family protein [bacterium]
MTVKEPKTYDEQLALIQNKGFIIDDSAACINFLKHTNYYRLSAFFIPFRMKDGTYQRNIPFERIQRIYQFDSRIRSLLFQTIEQIELYIRSTLSYYLAHKYGTLGYLNPDIFSKRHDAQKFNEKIRQCIHENSNSLVVNHHNAKYDGKFPIWVIIEYFSMGMLSYCYSDLKSADQKFIAKDIFSSSASCIRSWLRCVTDLRNRCAHYSRLYYWTFPAIPLTPKHSIYQMDRKLFSQMIMLKYLYPDMTEWKGFFVAELEALIEEYNSDISLKQMGFPDNWRELLNEKECTYFS